MSPIRRLLRRFWCPIRDRYAELADLRFHIVLLLVGAALIWWVPQGRDVIATISDAWTPNGGGLRRWWLFVLAIAFLGLQLWLWTRLLIVVRHGGRWDWRKNRVLVLTPRVLGILPYLIAAIALATVQQGHATIVQALIVAALAVPAYLFYWKRYELVRRLTGWAGARRLFSEKLPRFGLTPFELAMLALTLLIAVACLIWLAADPVTLPTAFGPAAMAFLGFALIVPVVSLMLALVTHERAPVLTGLALLAFVSSYFSDNHDVRELASAPRPRTALADSFATWLAQAPPRPDGMIPIVFVSAAGGASRAAFWTTIVLQQLDLERHARDPEGRGFGDSVFAISAVSGSALGAVDYVAALKAEGASVKRARLGLAHVSKDFLAPAVGGILYTDAVQRFIPLPVFRDRSWSIERGFERGWNLACIEAEIGGGCQDQLTRPFLDLWRAEPGRATEWRPNLLLVGTVQEDGRRIITSNLDLTTARADGRRQPLFPNSYDWFHVTGRDVRSSTAVMNSARFPWVSPAGGFYDRSVSESARKAGHVIDGGYFEASATETSYDLYLQVRALAPPAVRARLVPVFLTLINDEEVAPEDRERQVIDTVERDAPTDPPARGSNDLFAPLRGAFSTQGGRAELRMTRLARGAQGQATLPEPIDGRWQDIRLRPCRFRDERPMAMSWALSKPARERIYNGQVRNLRLGSASPLPADIDKSCGSTQQRAMAALSQVLGLAAPAIRR